MHQFIDTYFVHEMYLCRCIDTYSVHQQLNYILTSIKGSISLALWLDFNINNAVTLTLFQEVVASSQDISNSDMQYKRYEYILQYSCVYNMI